MSQLSSFSPALRAVVIGAAGGIGGALTAALADDAHVAHIHAFSRALIEPAHDKISAGTLDLTDEDSIAAAAASIKAQGTPDLVIVASGILHRAPAIAPEKSLRDLAAAPMLETLAVNTVGPALVMKHMLPLLPRDRKAVFSAFSARVGSIADNRLGGWHSYRASKAALNMLIRNAAIETGRRYKQAAVIGLHPGTVDTALSAPFSGNVPEGKLFAPAFAADKLLTVINNVEAADSGKIFAWDGQEIPY